MWLEQHPDIQHITFISDQPHVHYQSAVIQATLHALRSNITFEVVGPEASKNTKLSSIFSALGSYIWSATPNVLRELDIQADEALQQKYRSLYQSQPLVYNNTPSVHHSSFTSITPQLSEGNLK